MPSFIFRNLFGVILPRPLETDELTKVVINLSRHEYLAHVIVYQSSNSLISLRLEVGAVSYY
jgi:hypothetical protein